MLGVGLVARLVVAFTTLGVAFDVEAYSLVREGLATQPLDVYSETGRWPYPPGYFAWILISGRVEDVTGLSFSDLMQVPPILADLAIAWLVQSELGRRGAGERTRMAAAALVTFGPAFFVVSGYHAQIDSIAILPAIAGVLLWQRSDDPRRALWVGLLIGLGGLLKTVPLIVVLALLPSARSWREAATLVVVAGALPALAFLPFLLSDPAGVEEALRYRGVPGVGGISLLVQPELARTWMNEVPVTGSGITVALYDWGGAITAAALLAVAAFLLRFRPGPLEGAALLYLAVWAFGINFFLQYVIWGFPFLLMAGYVREVAYAQLLMLPAAVLVYLRPWEESAAAWAYVPASLAIWGAALAGVFLLGRRIASRGELGNQPDSGGGEAASSSRSASDSSGRREATKMSRSAWPSRK